jgi:hypothetical protein
MLFSSMRMIGAAAENAGGFLSARSPAPCNDLRALAFRLVRKRLTSRRAPV